MHQKLWIVFCALILSCFPVEAKPLDIKLVSAQTSIQPGQSFEVGLALKHKKHYHTYWQYPGVVGVPTAIEWQLPKGWKAEPIQWPAPKMVMMFTIRAQGYHDQVLLPIRLTAPKDLSPASSVTLKGRATWMCCYKDCNPGFADLELSLPVQTQASAPDPKWQQRFEASHAAVPQALTGWQIQAEVHNQTFELTLLPDSGSEFKGNPKELLLFTLSELVSPNDAQSWQQLDDGSLRLTMPISEYFEGDYPQQFQGVLQSSKAWNDTGAKFARITVPLKMRP